MRRLFVILCCIVFASEINAQEYTARVGDTLTVTVREREWLSGAQVVDANGQIALPQPVGTVTVLGLTAEQITELLIERLKEEIVAPGVFVRISPALRFTVHVTGEVQAPDSFEVVEGARLQAAITRAGGFTTFADKRHIKIIRKNMEQAGAISESIVDFTRFQENADGSANPPMKAGDMVVVTRLPKSERPVIMVIGAVNQPGAISTEEPLHLVEAILRAGGFSPNADLKNLSILRPEGGGYSRTQLNLEAFLTGGEVSANPSVSSGEMVFVPSEQQRQNTVNVSGAVLRPGSYPVYEGGRLFDAIHTAGGFTDSASVDRVIIIHPSNPSSQKIEVVAGNYLTTGDLKYNPLLEVGDTIFIPIQEETVKNVSGVQSGFFESIHVTLVGAVRRPDTYQVSKTATILDVLNLAGGHTEYADLDKVTIIRENIQIRINLEKVLQEGQLQSLPSLQANDTIRIPNIKEKTGAFRTILGIVRDAATIATVFLVFRRAL